MHRILREEITGAGRCAPTGNVIRFQLLLVVFMFVSGCAVVRTEATTRIALLAPFEGRYREIGYEALYAARLALQDSGRSDIDLLPIDDGGTPASAADRARALAQDPQITAVIAMGFAATETDTLAALNGLPAVVVGDWRTPSSDITEVARLNAPFTCGEVCALAQFPKLRRTLDGITIVTSARLPDADFQARYRASAEFAPAPGLIATLTYDAMNVLLGNAAGEQIPQRLVFDAAGQLIPAP